MNRSSPQAGPVRLGIPVYEGVNLLDVAGPFEIFKWVDETKGLDVKVLSENGRGVTTINGFRFNVDASFGETPTLDVLWTPGGSPEAFERLIADRDSPYLSYLHQVSAGARWVCSVCEGAILLARAGLLDGHRATTHWAFVECLRRFPAIDVDETHARFIVSGNRLTGGGISAGLDEALKLISLLFDDATAEDIQVTTQYFPAPPGSGALPPTPACTLRW